LNRSYVASGETHTHQGNFLAIRKWPSHEGEEEEEEEEERIIVHHSSWNLLVALYWHPPD
jgi:hypothetical protein